MLCNIGRLLSMLHSILMRLGPLVKTRWGCIRLLVGAFNGKNSVFDLVDELAERPSSIVKVHLDHELTASVIDIFTRAR